MVRKSAIIHIGTSKTGTSALQAFLSHNRSILPFSYPPGPGEKRVLKGIPTAGNGIVLAKKLIDRDLVGATNLIEAGALYSAERFWGIRPEVMRDWLRDFDHTVICYLRPQIELATSGFAQRLKTGHLDENEYEFFDRIKGKLLYHDRLTRMGLGDRLIVRKYHRPALVNQSIVDDFFFALGYARPEGSMPEQQVNLTHNPVSFAPDLIRLIAEYCRKDNELLDEQFQGRFNFNSANEALLESSLV